MVINRMFKKARIRMTLLSGGITTLILIVATLGYLYISEKNLFENRRYTYQSDIYNIAVSIENQSVISHAWLAQLEGGKNYHISILDNGTPFLFGKKSSDDNAELLDKLWQYYRQNEQFLTQNNISYKCWYKAFQTADAYCFVITVLQERTDLEMLIASPLSDIRNQLSKQRLTFMGIVIPTLIVVWIFSWFYTGRLLKPIEESRIRQNRFVASASHELRTPLAVILSCSESALHKISFLDSEKSDTNVINLRHDLNTVKSEALRSSRLLSDMLTLSSQDVERLDMHKAPVELDTLLLNACEAIERLATEKNIPLSVMLPNTPIPPCCCDAERITQVITILLHNAISYTPENGQVTVTLAYEKKRFVIKISDTGVGISDADKPHVFERFYRSEKARSDKNHFGLGLSIAYEIVATHNGSISIADNQTADTGTVFTVRLP